MLAPAWRWWKAAAVVAGVSLALEVAQYVTAVGSSDVTDVIVNTAGGLLGFAALGALRRRLRSKTPVRMTWILTAGTLLALVVAGLMIASFPHLTPMR
jgi:MYXO-CTERM domain-containing protein